MSSNPEQEFAATFLMLHALQGRQEVASTYLRFSSNAVFAQVVFLEQFYRVSELNIYLGPHYCFAMFSDNHVDAFAAREFECQNLTA